MSEYPSHYPTIKHIQEVTQFKKKAVAKAALETLIWLEQGAPYKFDGLPGNYTFNMEQFAKETVCGTACCIAGAMMLYTHKNNRDKMGGNLPEHYFDVEDDQLYDLFYPDNLGEQTAKQGYDALLGYLTTGEVVWTHPEYDD